MKLPDVGACSCIDTFSAVRLDSMLICKCSFVPSLPADTGSGWAAMNVDAEGARAIDVMYGGLGLSMPAVNIPADEA